jgi:tape measure domain-containing protein
MVNEKLIVELSADIKGLKSQLNTAQSDLKSFADSNKQTSDNIQNSFSGATDGIKNLVLGYLSLNAAIQAVGASFDTALKLDAINSALSAVLGSTEAAAAQFQQLSQFADQYGLNLIAVGEAYKNFAAAAVSANVPLEQTNYIFESVAKAASVLKLSNDDLKGSLNALSQMISKGTVSAEELRGQLGERLPGAFNLAAKAMGVTTAELGKMLENGEIMAGDLLPKLALELNKTFGDKITGNVDSLQASTNRLSNTFTTAINNGHIGEFFKTIIDGANRTLEILESKSWGEFFNRFTAAITGNIALADTYSIMYGELNKLNKEVKKTDVDVLKSFGSPAAPKTTATKRPKPGISSMSGMADLATVKAEKAAQDFAAWNAEVEKLSANVEALKGSFNGLVSDPEIEAFNTNLQTVVNLLGNALTSAFDAALINGENFFKVLGQALLNLVKKLLAAVAAAAILSFLLAPLGLGSAVTGFAPLFRQISGIDLTPSEKPKSAMVAMPTNTLGQGGYQIDIMGDKMRLLLDNNAIKNSRVV